MEVMSKENGVTLGSAVRSIRKERGWSLRDASERTGLSVSMLSKVENGQRSLTYDKLVRLAASLSVDISRLFTDQTPESPPNLHAGRRSVHRVGDGFVIEAGVYTYTYLAQDLVKKRFLPVLMDLHARSVDQFESLLRHEGEEFAIVLEGEVDVCIEIYAPLRLKVGESVFFESIVGHAYVNAGAGPARILTIASDATARPEAVELPIARPSRASRIPAAGIATILNGKKSAGEAIAPVLNLVHEREDTIPKKGRQRLAPRRPGRATTRKSGA
jgi:transcriptional regulator with XRE-family HTH domain